MKYMSLSLRSFACLLFAIAASLVGNVALAHEAGEVAVAPLLSELPADVSGKRMTMLKVTYPPGVSFAAHRHPGSVFVYVVSGEIRSQLGTDAAPITYKAGDSWYEDTNARHVYSDNPSKDTPAVIVAVLIGDDGDEMVLPDE